jgi:hypothetical protein
MEAVPESTTTRKAGGLDFTAIGGKRQGREVPQSLRVWKTQSKNSLQVTVLNISKFYTAFHNNVPNIGIAA